MFQKMTSVYFTKSSIALASEFPENGSDVFALDKQYSIFSPLFRRKKIPPLWGLLCGWVIIQGAHYKREERVAGHSNWRLARRYEYFVDILTGLFLIFLCVCVFHVWTGLTSLSFLYGTF